MVYAYAVASLHLLMSPKRHDEHFCEGGIFTKHLLTSLKL